MYRLSAIFLLLFLPASAFSMSISTVKLSDTADTNGYYTVTVTGAGFGLGPHVALYDDFNNQAAGQNVNLNQALIGTWINSTSYSAVPKVVNYGKGKAIQVHDAANDTVDSLSIAQIETVFSPKVSNIFVSYSVVIPEGKRFPGSSADLQFAPASTWKFTWISDTPNGIASTTKFNLCVPTHVTGSLLLAGNSVNYGWLTNAQNSWSWHTKNYMSFGINPDPNQPQTLPGTLYFQLSGKAGAPFVFRKTDTAIYPLTNTTSFDRIKFPGWFGNFGTTDKSLFDAYYDDIYVATGPTAFARVEVSDAASITGSVLNVTMPVIAWTDTNIQFKLHREHLQTGSRLFVRVHDKDDNNLPAPLPCDRCPLPPQNVGG